MARRPRSTYKLNDGIVRKLRRTAAAMVKDRTVPIGWQRDLAKKYNISRPALSAAITGASYRHLNAVVPGVRMGTFATRAKRPARGTDIASDTISRAKLGTEIQKYMQRTNMSQALFARLVDDAASQVSRVTQGNYREFSPERLCKWLLRVGYDISLTVQRPKGLKLGEGTARVTLLIK